MAVPARYVCCLGKLRMEKFRRQPAFSSMTPAAATFQAGMERILRDSMAGHTIIQDRFVQQAMGELAGILLVISPLVVGMAFHAVGPCETIVKGRVSSFFRVDRVRLMAIQAFLPARA